MQLSKTTPEFRLAALVSVGCLALAGLGWGYGEFVSPHGTCVGAVSADLAANEFSLVPDRADLAAARLCERAGDIPKVARMLSAGLNR